MKVRALWHNNRQRSEIREETMAPGTGQLLVRSRYSMISTGTERLVAKGLVPEALHALMRVPGMAGQFTFPVKYGYSVVGEVVGGPPELLNKMVHLMHPHQDICVALPEMVHVLEPGTDPLSATLISNMETIINALWDSEVREDDKVLVCGFGNIGGLLAKTLKDEVGARVYVAEKHAVRLQTALEMGFRPFRGEDRFDIAYNTTASGEGLQECLDALVHEGHVIDLSWYGTNPVNLYLGHRFHYGRLKIISSQVSHIPGKMMDKWDLKSRKRWAEQLISKMDFSELMSNPVPFNDIPAFFDKLRHQDAVLDDCIYSIAY